MPIIDDIYDTIYSTGETISITSSPVRILIQSGTYAGFTIGGTVDGGVLIEVEPNTVFSSALTFSGDNITMRAGTGTTFQGDTTMSGANNAMLCENGCTFDTSFFIQGSKNILDGGGKDTIVTDTVDISSAGSDCVICNISLDSGADATGLNTLESDGARCLFYNIKINDSDGTGFQIAAGNNQKIVSCHNVTSGVTAIQLNTDANIVFANNLFAVAGQSGVNIDTTNDDNIVVSNVIHTTAAGVNITGAGAADNIVAGNRSETAVTDSGTSSTVANNETGAI